jgi:hypothetical protein
MCLNLSIAKLFSHTFHFSPSQVSVLANTGPPLPRKAASPSKCRH